MIDQHLPDSWEHPGDKVWFEEDRKYYWIDWLDPRRKEPYANAAGGYPGPELLTAMTVMDLNTVYLSSWPAGMPTLLEAQEWMQTVETSWGPPPRDFNLDPLLPIERLWQHPLYLSLRFRDDESPVQPAWEEPLGERQLSSFPTVQGFPSPRDFNRVIDEYLTVVTARYKLAKQWQRICIFGVSGGRPGND